MRVLVCGGRDYADYDYLKTVLSALQVVRQPFTAIIHGGYRGADTLADHYAKVHSIEPLEFKADWREHSAAAGPLRNQRMIDEGKPDLVVAFPGHDGTADMVRRARAAGIEVLDARTPKEQAPDNTGSRE